MTYHPPHITRLEVDIDGAPDAELTVAPKTPHDVAAVLHHASDHGLTVQVWGSGTRSGFGSPPSPDIVMSMERLAEVEVFEPDDMTVVIGAGAKVRDLESMLAEHNQTAVMPEVPGASTIGGVIASGASALRRGRLFGTRERILEATVVTGDGRIVRSGGRVVKNVSGYDLQKAHVGAFGSLGVIVAVCLKLWPSPPAGATVEVGSPEDATAIARPLAVLEQNGGTRVFVWGTEAEVASKVERLGGRAVEGHDWPGDPSGPFTWSLRVPPALTAEALGRISRDWEYLAVHGVGEIRAASPDLDGAADVRSWAESVAGYLVSTGRPHQGADELDPWGSPPPGISLQRALIEQFDPARVINPGRLPGGL